MAKKNATLPKNSQRNWDTENTEKEPSEGAGESVVELEMGTPSLKCGGSIAQVVSYRQEIAEFFEDSPSRNPGSERSYQSLLH